MNIGQILANLDVKKISQMILVGVQLCIWITECWKPSYSEINSQICSKCKMLPKKNLKLRSLFLSSSLLPIRTPDLPKIYTLI